jgi:O-methyltransferase
VKRIQDQLDSKETGIIINELTDSILAGVDGDVVEFGCYMGLTTIKLARAIEPSSKKLFVYDSFEGLPEKSAKDCSPLGLHFRAGELQASKKQVLKIVREARVPVPIIRKAWFKDLTENDLPEKISFAFIDCDFYESVYTSLKLIENRIIPGSKIIVDDYSNSALPGGAIAVSEWIADKSYKLRVMHSLAIISV